MYSENVAGADNISFAFLVKLLIDSSIRKLDMDKRCLSKKY